MKTQKNPLTIEELWLELLPNIRQMEGKEEFKIASKKDILDYRTLNLL